MTSNCECCRLAEQLSAQDGLHRLGPDWTVNARVGHQRPGLVVQSTRHRPSLGDLTPAERASLGPALTAASAALAAQDAVARVYAHLWNEGTDPHVHFHVVPRMADDEEAGPTLPDLLTPMAAALPIGEIARAAASDGSGPRRERSALVRGVRAAARGWNRRLSPYGWFQRPAAIRALERLRLDPGEGYVLTWLLAAAALCALAALTDGAAVVAWFVCLLVAYRWADMLLYELGFLLTMERTPVRSIPRGVVMRALNLAEILLGTAAVIQTVSPVVMGDALQRGFATATLQPVLHSPGWVVDTFAVAGATTALLILSGGIAMLIGKVAETFEESP